MAKFHHCWTRVTDYKGTFCSPIREQSRKGSKMVRHTQTICWEHPASCLNVFDNFVGLALKGLKRNFLHHTVIGYLSNLLMFYHYFLCKASSRSTTSLYPKISCGCVKINWHQVFQLIFLKVLVLVY